NIADVRDGTHNSPRYIEFGYPLVTSKNIKNGQVNFEDIQYISSFDYEEINKRSKVNINDILMGMIGTVGNLALVREEPKFAIKNVALIKNIGVVNVEFLYHYLGSYVIERQLQNSLDGGTQKFISLNKIRHLDITFPSLPEQEVIGTFFSTLDQHITLHQRKLDTLKEQKKTYLKLLFPVKGQTKPALHFQGFEDDWEEVKLGEVVSISSGYTGDATLNNGKYKLTRIETISEGKVDVSRTGFSNELPDEKYRLNFGDILFSNINSLVHIGKVAIFNTMEEVFHGINLLRLVPNKDLINPYFIYYQLVTESKKNWSKAHANQAVNQASINQTSLSTQKISISSLPEQEVIGTFFQNLDQEIAQVEDKLASLKEMKKTLLRKLFV
ncbi:TPA: restriction endonuclease subunit S, partial [Streptococcus suis]